jgi:hypothetical protein
MPIAVKYINHTHFILAASPSAKTDQEWVDAGEDRASLPGPVHKDYALMKVLYMLRSETKSRHIHSFKYEDPVAPIDLSLLQDTDIIYIVAHGDEAGIYSLGPPVLDPDGKPDGSRNQDRLIEVLTKDGNLKKKREGKEIIICLLSCRAGFGYHKAVAQKLFKKLGGTIEVKVAGAKGFTFGSIRTSTDSQNEVLIKGIPWFMEYPDDITKADAERETSAREKRPIKYDDNKTDIDAFQVKSGDLVKHIKKVIKDLTSTEINAALNEIQDGSERDWWLTLVWQQQQLYANARTKSNLEFDMWYESLTEAYEIANGRGISDADVASISRSIKKRPKGKLTSVK